MIVSALFGVVVLASLAHVAWTAALVARGAPAFPAIAYAAAGLGVAIVGTSAASKVLDIRDGPAAIPVRLATSRVAFIAALVMLVVYCNVSWTAALWWGGFCVWLVALKIVQRMLMPIPGADYL